MLAKRTYFALKTLRTKRYDYSTIICDLFLKIAEDFLVRNPISSFQEDEIEEIVQYEFCHESDRTNRSEFNVQLACKRFIASVISMNTYDEVYAGGTSVKPLFREDLETTLFKISQKATILKLGVFKKINEFLQTDSQFSRDLEDLKKEYEKFELDINTISGYEAELYEYDKHNSGYYNLYYGGNVNDVNYPNAKWYIENSSGLGCSNALESWMIENIDPVLNNDMSYSNYKEKFDNKKKLLDSLELKLKELSAASEENNVPQNGFVLCNSPDMNVIERN